MPPVLATVQTSSGMYIKVSPGKTSQACSLDQVQHEEFRDYETLDPNSQVSQFYKTNHEFRPIIMLYLPR